MQGCREPFYARVEGCLMRVCCGGVSCDWRFGGFEVVGMCFLLLCVESYGDVRTGREGVREREGEGRRGKEREGKEAGGRE